MALLPGHRTNFQTLQDAFAAGDVALMECQLAETGEEVAVICAANRQEEWRRGIRTVRHAVQRQPLRNAESAEARRWLLSARGMKIISNRPATCGAVVFLGHEFRCLPHPAVITFTPKGQSMRSLTRKKQRQLFVAQATKLLLELGAKQDGGETYRFTLQTKAGRLRLHPDADQNDGPGTVFTCFDNPQAARQFVDCNQFSGKWNFHYFDGWTVETAIRDFSARLRLVLV